MSERTFYPLTSGQMILLYSQKYSMKKQVNNVCATIRITSPVDEELLLQALTLALMRSPSINCRFTTQGKETVQYFCHDLPRNLEIEDFSQATEEQIQARVDEWSAQPFPNKCMDVPLYRVKVLRLPEGKFMLYLCMCHMIMDAYAIMSCIDYMGQVYEALRDGKALPEIKSTPIECYQAEYDYFASDRYQKDKEFWDQHLDTEPTFTSPNGLGGKEYLPGKKCGITLRLYQVAADHANLVIPKEVVSAVQALCMQRRISTQCAYLLAIRSYLAAVCKTDDVLLMNTVARRATLVQKHAGGSMVNAIPFRTIIPGETSFLDGLNMMYREQREIYRQAAFPCGQILDLLFKFDRKDGIACHSYNSVSVTFQPFFNTDGGVLDYTFRREKNGAATQALYISIMPYDNSGDLWANYEYIIGYVKPESVRKLHDFMVKFLCAATADPEKSIEELSEIALA